MGDDKAKCPVCKEKVDLESDLEVGDIIYCPGCYADLEITKLSPLTLAECVDSQDDDYDQEEEY